MLLVPFAGCSNPKSKLIGKWSMNIEVLQWPGEVQLELKNDGGFRTTNTAPTAPPNIQQFNNKIQTGHWDLTKQGDTIVFEFDISSGSTPSETHGWQLRNEGDRTFLVLTSPDGFVGRTLTPQAFGVSNGTYTRVN